MTRSPVARRGRAGWCLLLIAGIVAPAACDDAPRPSASAPSFAPFTSATNSAAPPASAPAATDAADVKLPPGAQFARAPTSIPGEAEPVVTQFLTRAYFFSTSGGHPDALYRDGSTWQRATIDDGSGYKPPSGALLDGPFRVVGAASNDTAMVVLGASTTTDDDRPAGFDRLPASVIWVTHDGKAFQRIDARGVVDAESIRITSVAAVGGGFVAVADILPNGFDDPGGVIVLSSDDGEHWSAGERLRGQGTLHARALHHEGEFLAIEASDQWCDDRAISFPVGVSTGITVLWVSADGGGTWSEADLTGAAPVLEQASALIEGCPPNLDLTDLIALSQELDTQGAIVGVAGGTLLARSRDGTSVGVATGLGWKRTTLPEAVPLPEDGREPYAQSIVAEFDGTVSLVALEDRADADGRPRSGGCQVRWWRSGDGGATWATGPWGRPFASCGGARWSFEQLLDSSVVLFANAITANTNRGEASFRTATAGAFLPWATCAPGPNADCSFATITRPTSEAPDWPGINLSGATITDAAIPGAQLPKANAYAALLSGTFGAADLRDALLSYAVLEGDFRGADFSGASLVKAVIRADLTGANLAGAELSGAIFEAGSVCPDGAPPQAGATDAKAACRL